MELLQEIAQPALRDLRVEFRGFRTVRVYPEQLPNLAPGTQQIILGRYLPEGQDQAGEVVLVGVQGGKPVRFAAKVSLKDAEAGNSFIPRLWARMHLDALLEQGSSPAVRDQIIALSQRYQIITPYTSLLVLESDADRERFQVRRQFRMRDGEQFFAQGRDGANWELVQQQMRQAGAWRSGLRREVLRQLGTLGRDVEPLPAGDDTWCDTGGGAVGSGLFGSGAFGFRAAGDANPQAYRIAEIDQSAIEPWEIEPGIDLDGQDQGRDAAGQQPGPPQDRQPGSGRDETPRPRRAGGPGVPAAAGLPVASGDSGEFSPLLDIIGPGGSTPRAGRPLAMGMGGMGGMGMGGMGMGGMGMGVGMGGMGGEFDQAMGVDPFRSQRLRGQAAAWPALFPEVPPVPPQRPQPKTSWPAEARALAHSLLRVDVVRSARNGLRIEMDEESSDPRWNNVLYRSETMVLFSPSAWLVREALDDWSGAASPWQARSLFSPAPWATGAQTDGRQTKVAWCDGREVGAFSKDLLLGTVRASRPGDLRGPLLELGDGPLLDLGEGTVQPLDQSYPSFRQMKPQGGGRTLLVLADELGPAESRVLIDTMRSVVLKVERVYGGKVVSTSTFGDFVQVAGAWFAGRIETADAKGRRTSVARRKLIVLRPGDLERQWSEELADRQRAQLLRQPMPRLSEAKRASAAGKATVEDELVLLLHFQGTQQWDRAVEHLRKAERLSRKPAMRWVRYSILLLCSRHEELKLSDRVCLGAARHGPARGGGRVAGPRSWRRSCLGARGRAIPAGLPNGNAARRGPPR